MITAVKTRMDCVRLAVKYSGTAPVVDTEGGCPDSYDYPICAIALRFPGDLLSLRILYLKIQPVAASMKYLI